MEKAKHKTAHIELMQALNFSLDDLEANRAGKLSAGQRQAIRQEGCGYHAMYGISATMMLFILVWLIFFQSKQPFSAEALIATGIAAVILFVWYQAYRYYETLAKVTDVKIVRSVIRKQVTQPQKGHRRLIIIIDGTRFMVEVDVFNALTESREYYFYLAPHSEQILAAEPVIE